MNDVAARMSALREQRGWTKTFVAKKLHLSLSTYANYEYGIRKPNVELLSDIAKLYDVSTDYLLGSKKENIDSKEKTVDELINQMQQYEGRPITDADRETIRGIIKGYLNVRPD